jgi:hypothetical protein
MNTERPMAEAVFIVYCPPSTRTMAPVVKEDAGLAR